MRIIQGVSKISVESPLGLQGRPKFYVIFLINFLDDAHLFFNHPVYVCSFNCFRLEAKYIKSLVFEMRVDFFCKHSANVRSRLRKL